MGRPLAFSSETKTRIVVSGLSGEISVAEAARTEKVSEQSIGRWRAEFNIVRPHEARAWNRPSGVHRGLADPAVPDLSRAREPASYLTRDTVLGGIEGGWWGC